jgi:hypothetical protein
MSIYLLNLSVDTSDAIPNHFPEDLTINDQESIIEIIAEQILGFENAIKEYDDIDNEEHNKKTSIKLEIFDQKPVNYSIRQPFIKESKQKFNTQRSHLTHGFKQLETPPPKV